MKFLSIRELRSSTGVLKEMLENNGKVVLTSNGKPTAIMIGVNEDSFEETLSDLSRIRALRALQQLQEESVRNGTDKMTMEEIDAEIAAARAERKAKLNMKAAI